VAEVMIMKIKTKMKAGVFEKGWPCRYEGPRLD
jgi:hypothetical protein